MKRVKQFNILSDVVDRAGQLAAYGATSRTLVPIRPDGYMAFISDATDPMLELRPFSGV